jgi:hypothetical protein
MRRHRNIRVLIAGTIAGTVICCCGLAGCSGSAASGSASSSAAVAGAPQGAAAAPGAVNGGANGAGGAASGTGSSSSAGGAFGPNSPAGSGQSAHAARIASANQEIIYTAQLTVRAKDVPSAVIRATQLVDQAGGYVSSENATSDPDHPQNATATIEFKIPVLAYQATLASLSGGPLGEQLSLQQQAQDVTQQVADVNSQVASDEAAIAQLRSLLKNAGSVGDLLQVQDQINTEESDLEGMEAQARALTHETSYATVTVTLVGPKAPVPTPKPKKPVPPPGLVSGATGGWHAFKLTIDWLLAFLGAVAPFAVSIAVLAALVLWLRRRWRARQSDAPTAS